MTTDLPAGGVWPANLCGAEHPGLTPDDPSSVLRCSMEAGHEGSHGTMAPVRIIWPRTVEAQAMTLPTPTPAVEPEADPTPPYGIDRASILRRLMAQNEVHDQIARTIADIAAGTERLRRLNDDAEAFSVRIRATLGDQEAASIIEADEIEAAAMRSLVQGFAEREAAERADRARRLAEPDRLADHIEARRVDL